MEEKLIHIYCGDGKGKTTSAVGLAVRCAGSGGRVLFMSFLKDNKSSELNILRSIPNINVVENPTTVKFFKNMNEDEKRDMLSVYAQKIEKLKDACEYDMVVLDEVIHAVNYGFIDEQELIEIIKKGRQNTEYVLTGRNPSNNLIDIADYVSEIKKVKHPFDKGVTARVGIEM